MPQVERTATRIAGFGSGELDFQLMRSLGAASYGGGVPGEVFYARGRIADEDPAAWPPVFAGLAREVDSLGEAAARSGHGVSARDHYLRAAMYWRAAEYFTDPFSPDVRVYGLASRASFAAAIPFMADAVEPMRIPFEGVQLPGYFMQPAGRNPDAGPRPTVLIVTGFDGTSEELYFQAGRAALERGWNVAIAEGPGQMGTLRDHPELTFRPDYETPIAAMLDAVLARPEVDARRLALYGISFGGYFALRAAAHDARIRALVVNSPIVDLKRYMLGFLPEDARNTEHTEDLPLAAVDEVPDDQFPRLQKHMFKAACRRFGVAGYHAWIDALTPYTVQADLGRITCPALALCGEGEGGEALAQFETFCREAGGPVTRYAFTAQLGADMHCQLGNLPLSNAVIFDWLQERLG